MASASTNIPALTVKAVEALREALRELRTAINVAGELHDEAVTLTKERDRARSERDAFRDAAVIAKAAEEDIARRFDIACTERDAALYDLSAARASLTDLARRVQEFENTLTDKQRSAGRSRRRFHHGPKRITGII